MKFKTFEDIDNRIQNLFSCLNITPVKKCRKLVDVCSDFEYFNDTVLHKNILCSAFNGMIINVVEPKNLNRMHYYEELLTLMTCLRGWERKDYKQLHPNRLKLKFFWLYKLNLLDKSAICYQEVNQENEEIDENDETEFDPIDSEKLEDLANEFRSILGLSALPKKTEAELRFRDTHCFNSADPSCTCPPCTPTVHGKRGYFAESTYCWGFFVSKCDECNFRVWKSKQIKCLACYYFGSVLNELHEKWASLSKNDRSGFFKKSNNRIIKY